MFVSLAGVLEVFGDIFELIKTGFGFCIDKAQDFFFDSSHVNGRIHALLALLTRVVMGKYQAIL